MLLWSNLLCFTKIILLVHGSYVLFQLWVTKHPVKECLRSWGNASRCDKCLDRLDPWSRQGALKKYICKTELTSCSWYAIMINNEILCCNDKILVKSCRLAFKVCWFHLMDKVIMCTMWPCVERCTALIRVRHTDGQHVVLRHLGWVNAVVQDGHPPLSSMFLLFSILSKHLWVLFMISFQATMCNISIKSTHRPKVTKVLRVQGMQRHVISHTYAGAAGSWHKARKGVESIVLHFQANQYEETAFTQKSKTICRSIGLSEVC